MGSVAVDGPVGESGAGGVDPSGAGSVAGQGGAGGVRTAGAVYSATGVGGCAGEVEPVDRGVGAAQAGYWAEAQLLVQPGGAGVDRTVHSARTVPFQVGRPLHVPADDQGTEAGGVSLDDRLHPVGDR